MGMEIGYAKGEFCNREGCKGIIDEYPKEGGCSCHINTPCSYCTEETGYCPKCGWDAKEEYFLYEDARLAAITPDMIAKFEKELKQRQEKEELFNKRFWGKEEAPELEMRHKGHTHFSQIIEGVFPLGTETRESILPKVRGPFGGRFEIFDNFRFRYIAYTD